MTSPSGKSMIEASPGLPVRFSYLSQKIFDWYLTVPRSTFPLKVVSRILGKLRWVLSRTLDPIVTFRLENTDLLIPLSHDLPLNRRIFPKYQANVGHIAATALKKYPDLCAIDIGANIGDTAAILKSQGVSSILCIEGHPRFFQLLQRNSKRIGHLDLECCFIGPTTEKLSVEIRRDSGTIRLIRNPESTTVARLRTLSSVLDGYPRFQRSKLLKIDTDGWDCRILISEVDLIKSMKPLVFFEYDPDFYRDDPTFNPADVFKVLKDIGYVTLVAFENNGDYLLTAELQNIGLLEDLHAFCSRSSGHRYLDICAFHAEDQDICGDVRSRELSLKTQRLN